MKSLILKVVIGILPLVLTAQNSSLTRENDPVVISGNKLSFYAAKIPNQLVGFKFVNNQWVQIPIQIDERNLMDIVTPYGAIATAAGFPPDPSNPKALFYCDPSTEIGSDPITTFDEDDELVFMVKDCGGQSDGSTPNGTLSDSCQVININDPLGGIGYVYLFLNDGTLQQDAGINYVSYTSNLTSTAGFPAHANGTNLENTTISTAKYSWHYSAEWVCDIFKLITGNNSDILDRYKVFFADGNCQRHEDSFSEGENAFVTVKEGPLRIIRSYMGANSGPLTQRTHLFYEGRQDIFTDLRVHTISSIYDAFDYNSNANGMLYYNNLNTSEVTIDGSQDSVTLGDLEWEFVSGSQGSISIIQRRKTTLESPADASFTSYYDDDEMNPASNCTGDGQAWGTSGVGVIFENNIHTNIMAIDANYRTFQNQRTVYIDPAGADYSLAENYNNQIDNPLHITISNCSNLGFNSPINEDNSIKVFPNPNTGTLYFTIEKNYLLRIYNTTGQLILVTEISKMNNRVEFKNSGFFTLQFTDGKGNVLTKKIVMK